MKEKKGTDIYLDYVPVLKKWYIAIATSLYQLMIFVLVMIIFWWISSNYLLGALYYQIIIAFLAILPFAYVTKNSDKLRVKYREKYGDLAYQHLDYMFLIYTVPLGAASLYFPIILKTDYFLPAIISLKPHFITNDLFPYYSAIPIGLTLIIIGYYIRRPSGGFDYDIDSYIYLMFPEKSRKVEGGIYKYVRHPRYLGRFFMVMGIGALANNILAISVALIHFLSYFLLIWVEDSELVKRFGESFKKHTEEVPALVPKYGNWRKFTKLVFTGKE